LLTLGTAEEGRGTTEAVGENVAVSVGEGVLPETGIAVATVGEGLFPVTGMAVGTCVGIEEFSALGTTVGICVGDAEVV
jgi:hypothetical protein